MRTKTCSWLALLLLALFQTSKAQDISNVPCDQVHAMARMARANSLKAMAQEKQDSGTTYRAGVIFAARSFELQPGSRRAAALLLGLLPQDDKQHVALMTLGDSLCDAESADESTWLSRLGERLSRDFAKAVVFAPDLMPKYVAYALTSVQDPHSDYAVQMQAVCRARRPEFIKSVEGLPVDKRDWFVKHVFNPSTCHALALPEAE